jgi:hypothetical protein
MKCASAVAFAIAAASVAACSRAPAPDAGDDARATATIAAPATWANTDATPTPVDEPTADTRELLRAFRGGDSYASLRDRFGATNVVPQDIAGPEGEIEHGVLLFPDDPMRRATLYFADPDKLEGLALVRIIDPESTWSIDHDIRMGTTLAELVARNGGPIEFSGFGWDFGGAIAGFGGGRLESPDYGGAQPSFRLAPRQGMAGDPALPVGEATFSSADYPGLSTDIVVGELTVNFRVRSDR